MSMTLKSPKYRMFKSTDLWRQQKIEDYMIDIQPQDLLPIKGKTTQLKDVA